MDGRASPLCPRFHRAVELIGRRWTGAVLQLLMAGRRRYSDLKAGVPDISDRMLSERLRELEAEGLVRRIVTPETPVRVEYELTEKGRSLKAPLDAIAAWASEWIEPAEPTLPGKAAEERDEIGRPRPGGPEGAAGSRQTPEAAPSAPLRSGRAG